MNSRRYLSLLPLLALAVAVLGSGCTKSQGVSEAPIFREDFSGGLERWDLHPVANWELSVEDGDTILCLTRPGVQREVRAPTAWAVVKNLDLHGFVMEGRFRSTAPVDNPNRDLNVFFNYQDSLHFYYVHFSARSDRVHNIIGLVNGADRVKVNLEEPGKSEARLKDADWHHFRVQYDPASGRVEAFLDDFTRPVLTAVDTVLRHGTVGVGSFDDTGCFDDLRVWSRSGSR